MDSLVTRSRTVKIVIEKYRTEARRQHVGHEGLYQPRRCRSHRGRVQRVRALYRSCVRVCAGVRESPVSARRYLRTPNRTRLLLYVRQRAFGFAEKIERAVREDAY